MARTVLGFDEINKLSMPFEKYFGEMELTKRQKTERIDLARAIEAAMLYFFDAVAAGNIDNIDLMTLLIDELEEAVDETIEDKSVVPEVLAALLYRVPNAIYDPTMRNIDKPETLSEDRARFIAEEESNTIHNHIEYIKAIKGGKKRKRWHTMRDKKVRKTHKPMDGQTIPIADFFSVGDAMLLYPRDMVNGFSHPEEIIGCRCTIEYL